MNHVATLQRTSTVKLTMKKVHLWWVTYGVGDWLLIVVLLGIDLIMQAIQPHHRLIVEPKDPSINYPLRSQTVPAWMLFVIAGGLPFLIVLLVWYTRRSCPHARHEARQVSFALFLCILLTWFATDMIKKLCGRPRPNFIQLAEYVNGEATSSFSHVREAYQSFPSGHASLSMSGCAFISQYLFHVFRLGQAVGYTKKREEGLYNEGYKTVLCVIPVIIALLVGVSRITDFWHNFDDVLAGCCLGLSFAALIYYMHVTCPLTHYHTHCSSRVVPTSSTSASDHEGHLHRGLTSDTPVHSSSEGSVDNEAALLERGEARYATALSV